MPFAFGEVARRCPAAVHPCGWDFAARRHKGVALFVQKFVLLLPFILKNVTLHLRRGPGEALLRKISLPVHAFREKDGAESGECKS